MDNATKQHIVNQLSKLVKAQGLNKTAKQLSVSSATLSNMTHGKWEKMSDDLFRGLEAQLTTPADKGSVHVETRPFKTYSRLFNLAISHGQSMMLVSQPGSGKTYTLDYYRNNFKNVFYVKCLGYTTPRDFQQDLARSMGISLNSYRLSEQLRKIVSELKKKENPLILIDEIEKIKGADILMLFIDLYNEVKGSAGIILLGTPNLLTRVEKLTEHGKIGYNEVLSRVGGNIIVVPSANYNDALSIVLANGITDPDKASGIANDCDTKAGYYDLRRVDRKILAEKLEEVA